MDVQEAVAEGSASVDNGEVKQEGKKQFQMGPGDILEGKAVLEGSNVTLKGAIEGHVTARDKLTLGRNARLSGDIVVRRLEIADGATLNGHVRMGDFEHQASGQ
jgi:cytoskeletal protein CcmA (bactofilin family)